MGDLILAILCAWRLTQLLIWDDLLSPVTCWLANRHRLLDELFGCPHCMGFWCALVTVVAVTQDHWLIRIGVWAFAVSGAVSLIQHATGWLDIEVTERLPPYPGQEPDQEGRVAYNRERIVAAWKVLGYDTRHAPKGEGE